MTGEKEQPSVVERHLPDIYKWHILLVELGWRPPDHLFFEALDWRQQNNPEGKSLTDSRLIMRAITSMIEGNENKLLKGTFAYRTGDYLAIGETLLRHTQDESIVAAGILHDSPRWPTNGQNSWKKLLNGFGFPIYHLVQELPENLAQVRELNLRQGLDRNDDFLKDLRAASVEAQMVTAAICIQELQPKCSVYIPVDETEWAKYILRPNRDFLFYGQVLKTIENGVPNVLAAELECAIDESREFFGEHKTAQTVWVPLTKARLLLAAFNNGGYRVKGLNKWPEYSGSFGFRLDTTVANSKMMDFVFQALK